MGVEQRETAYAILRVDTLIKADVRCEMNLKHGLAALFLLAGTLVPLAAQDDQVGISAEEISTFPILTLTSLTPREDLMYDRRYMKLTGGAEVFDAPNGAVVRTLDPGYVYVTALGGDDNGFTRINRSEWVRSEMLTSMSHLISPFTGIELPPEPLPHPIGWALVDTYVSSVPGIVANEDTADAVLVRKYDRLNLYSSTIVKDENGDDRVWYQIGANQWIHQYNVSKFEALTELPSGVDTNLWFSIDLYEQNITLYRGTTPVFVTLTGTGLPRWPTYEGVFHIYYRAERENMSWGTVGDDYYLIEEVPWTMYFDDGRALHGAYWHNSLGFRRSHGCVNMSITDANYMYEQVNAFLGEDVGYAVENGPAVYIYSSGTYNNHR